MITCSLCGRNFDPDQLPADPEVTAGLLLAEECYQDAGLVCGDCLASRGRLALMYDPNCRH